MKKNLPLFEGNTPDEQILKFSGSITEEELQPPELLKMDDPLVMTVDVVVTQVGFSRKSDGTLIRSVTVKAIGARIDATQTYPATFEPETESDDGPSAEFDEIEPV